MQCYNEEAYTTLIMGERCVLRKPIWKQLLYAI